MKQHDEMRCHSNEMKTSYPYGPIPIGLEDQSEETNQHQQVDKKDGEFDIAALRQGKICSYKRKDRSNQYDPSAKPLRPLTVSPDNDARQRQTREV